MGVCRATGCIHLGLQKKQITPPANAAKRA
jgi:hypothetical protein